jgi:malate dehydrogenase (quinone)
MENKYEVVIVGGGISGAALAYELARYTDIKSICVLEKYEGVGILNTSGRSNSQTIHFGDIETNYTLEKAAVTKQTGKMVEKYCLQYGLENDVMHSHQKMALGVGDKEVEYMLNRYEEFKNLFPNLQVWDKEKLKEIEPRLVFGDGGKERPETIVGVGSVGEWTTVDFEKMAKSLLENAQKQEGTTVDVFLNSKVEEITKNENTFTLKTPNKTVQADFVVANAGAHSLYLAHQMGYGHEFSCLPVAGSFYLTNDTMLNGKVYMVQNPKLPFAALHGDPDILENGLTRFGPTALVMPKLERYRAPMLDIDFWKTLRLDGTIIKILFDLMSDSDVRNYILRNFLFEIPYFNKLLFVKDAKKIIPALKADEIRYADGFGGVRPQVLNKVEGKLMLGEASINTGEGIIFNMTPSPGATSCLGNAKRDVLNVTKFLGKTFDIEKFEEELVEKTPVPGDIDQEEQKKIVAQIRSQIKS